jgi:hypothetical protein
VAADGESQLSIDRPSAAGALDGGPGTRKGGRLGGRSRLGERLRAARAHDLVALGGEPGQRELLELGQLFDGRVPVGDAVLQIRVLGLQTLDLGLFVG